MQMMFLFKIGTSPCHISLPEGVGLMVRSENEVVIPPKSPKSAAYWESHFRIVGVRLSIYWLRNVDFLAEALATRPAEAPSGVVYTR